MCARYTMTKHKDDLLATFDVKTIDPFKPDTNIAPTDGGLIIRADKPDEIHNYHFGLVPWHAKDKKGGFKNVNARNDNLLSSGQWKPLVEKHKRCLVLADGFYEWEKSENGERLPWRITLKDRDLFAFAGLYSTWVAPDHSETYRSFTIITTDPIPGGKVEKFHDRMPVILSKEDEKLWLSMDVPLNDIIALTKHSAEEDNIHAYRVSKAINITRGGNNKGPDLILPENSH